MEPFFPAYIFCQGARPMNKENPAANVFCLYAAWMAEFGLLEVPLDQNVAFMYYYRSSKDECPSSKFEVAIRLIGKKNLSAASKKAHHIFHQLIPTDCKLPLYFPSLDPYLTREATFRTLSASQIGLISFPLLYWITQDPEISFLLSIISAGSLTYALEYYLSCPKTYDFNSQDLERFCEQLMRKGQSALDIDLFQWVKGRHYDLTPNFCSALETSLCVKHAKILTWTENYIKALQLLAPARLFTEDSIPQ